MCIRDRRTALTATEPFSKLLAAGLSFVFGLQVFAILGGVTRLLPLTGLTTPFMSQGGSSLVANWVTIGLLLIITHQVRRPVADQAAEPEQWLESETTQMIIVGSAPSPDPIATPPSNAGNGDEPTEIVGMGGRP